jgi:hypothetical protein
LKKHFGGKTIREIRFRVGWSALLSRLGLLSARAVRNRSRDISSKGVASSRGVLSQNQGAGVSPKSRWREFQEFQWVRRKRLDMLHGHGKKLRRSLSNQKGK